MPDASHGLPITHADRVNALLGEHLTAGWGRGSDGERFKGSGDFGG